MTNPQDKEKTRTPITSIRIHSSLRQTLPFNIAKGLEEKFFSEKPLLDITMCGTDSIIFDTRQYAIQNHSIRETYEFVLYNQKDYNQANDNYSMAVLKLNMKVLSEFNQLDTTRNFHDVYEYETAVEQLLSHFMLLVNKSIFTNEDRIRLMGHSRLMMLRNITQVLQNPNSKINEGGAI
tara:strand:+ start:125 stop:661 length:537 start_codon:yes stop_codon:yes gene_type:complete